MAVVGGWGVVGAVGGLVPELPVADAAVGVFYGFVDVAFPGFEVVAGEAAGLVFFVPVDAAVEESPALDAF